MSLENGRNGSKQELKDYTQDLLDRSERHPGALKVLTDILQEKGPDVYDRVAPHLGEGPEIWAKYHEECGEDLDVLIEKYDNN